MSGDRSPLAAPYPVPTRVAAAVAVAAAVIHLAWRVTSTWQGADPLLYVLVLAAEVLVVGRLATRHLLMAASRRHSVPTRTTPHEAEVVLLAGNESALQFRMALLSVVAAPDVGRVRVLDVYRREDVASHCERLGVSRSAADGWTTGGQVLAELIADTDAPLLALVPASAAATPDLVRRARGLFTEPRVGVVTASNPVVAHTGLLGGEGYPLTSDQDTRFVRGLDSLDVTLPLDGPVLLRTDLAKTLPTPSGPRPEIDLALTAWERGWRVRVAPVPGALRRPPWSEGQALDDRARAMDAWYRNLPRLVGVVAGRAGRGVPGRLAAATTVLELAQPLARAAFVVLPPLVVATGRIPATVEPVDALRWSGPWLVAALVVHRLGRPRPTSPLRLLHAGFRTLGVDLDAMVRARRRRRPGDGPTLQRGVSLTLLVSASVSAALIATGRSPLPDLATAVAMVVVLVQLLVARDVLWAQKDRQRRILPRVPLPPDPAETVAVTDLSALGAGFVTRSPLEVGARIRFDLTVVHPRGGRVHTQVDGVVARVDVAGSPSVGYLQFEPDDEAFDELLYHCGMTAPFTSRHEPPVCPLRSGRPTGEVVEVPDLRRSLLRMSRRSTLTDGDLAWLRHSSDRRSGTDDLSVASADGGAWTPTSTGAPAHVRSGPPPPTGNR